MDVDPPEDEIPFQSQLTPLTPANVPIHPSFGTGFDGSIPTILGRLLTPAEGCGFSAGRNTKIVGGVPAKNGAWPWAALLVYKEKNGGASANCGW